MYKFVCSNVRGHKYVNGWLLYLANDNFPVSFHQWYEARKEILHLSLYGRIIFDFIHDKKWIKIHFGAHKSISQPFLWTLLREKYHIFVKEFHLLRKMSSREHDLILVWKSNGLASLWSYILVYNTLVLNNWCNTTQYVSSLFCFAVSYRNPIPDYYSITLEISRDRTTAARKITCNSKDPNMPKCPPNLKDGESFLYRTLNEECKKMVSVVTNAPNWWIDFFKFSFQRKL